MMNTDDDVRKLRAALQMIISSLRFSLPDGAPETIIMPDGTHIDLAGPPYCVVYCTR